MSKLDQADLLARLSTYAGKIGMVLAGAAILILFMHRGNEPVRMLAGLAAALVALQVIGLACVLVGHRLVDKYEVERR